MAWESATLASDELQILERAWPDFERTLLERDQRTFTVDNLITWLRMRTKYNVVPTKGDRGKRRLQEENPGMVILNAQNALYHLSANSPEFVIHQRGREKDQVRLIQHIDTMTYRLL